MWRRLPIPIPLALLLSLVVCATRGGSSCEEMEAGMAKDTCLHDEIGALPASEVQTVERKGMLIADPMIRGSSISPWVVAHQNEISPQDAQALCLLLDGRDRSYCQRRLSSPHLQR